MNNNLTPVAFTVLALCLFLAFCSERGGGLVKCLEWETNGLHGIHRDAECVRWE